MPVQLLIVFYFTTMGFKLVGYNFENLWMSKDLIQNDPMFKRLEQIIW